jgi:hypothetical protein
MELGKFFDLILNTFYGHERTGNRGSLIKGGPITGISVSTMTADSMAMVVTTKGDVKYKLTVERFDG